MTDSRNSKLDALRERAAQNLAWAVVVAGDLLDRPVDHDAALAAARRTMSGSPQEIAKATAALKELLATLGDVFPPTVH